MDKVHIDTSRKTAYTLLYKSLPDAGITCLDYSADMMKNAERRASAVGVKNVSLVHGHVGALPFETGESQRARLENLYGQVEVSTVNAEGIFRCVN